MYVKYIYLFQPDGLDIGLGYDLRKFNRYILVEVEREKDVYTYAISLFSKGRIIKMEKIPILMHCLLFADVLQRRAQVARNEESA